MSRELLEAAWDAFEYAYAPYSGFHVGAAIQTRSGKIWAGCNVEVANFGCTLCAERTAIVKAVSENDLIPGELDVVLVAAKTKKPTAPCGSCRQMIEEFSNSQTRILLSPEPGVISLELLHSDLLPYSFSGKDFLVSHPKPEPEDI